MKIEVWSDVLCPFCYIGKRKLEQALAQFPQRDQVEVVWKSFQLDPDFQADTDALPYADYLQQRKGFPKEQVAQMLVQVTGTAKQVGLDFHFDRAVVANSFHAHRLLHLAQSQGVQNAAKEALLKAHFEEGKDIGHLPTLTAIGQSVGLAQETIEALWQTDHLADEVQHDIYEARQLQVQGVPFFVFDNKYAISGAQDSSLFLQALQKTFAEQAPQPLVSGQTGNACDIDGQC